MTRSMYLRVCVMCVCIYVFVLVYACFHVDCTIADYSRVERARVDYLVGQAPLSLSSMTWPHQLTALSPPLLNINVHSCARLTKAKCTLLSGQERLYDPQYSFAVPQICNC